MPTSSAPAILGRSRPPAPGDAVTVAIVIIAAKGNSTAFHRAVGHQSAGAARR